MARIAAERDGGGHHERLGFLVLEPLPESVAAARRCFREFIEAGGLRCSVDDCVLLLSEVLTNAITHGQRAGDGQRVRVEWWRDGRALRVDVHNPHPGVPAQVRLREASVYDTHGRGLALVDAIADRWEVGPGPVAGTRVSFLLDDVWDPSP